MTQPRRSRAALVTWPNDSPWLGWVNGNVAGWSDLAEVAAMDDHFDGVVNIPTKFIILLQDDRHWTVEDAIAYIKRAERLTQQD